MFRRVQTTEPVKSFVFEQLKKSNMLLVYGELDIRDLVKELRKSFKPKMDKWLFKRANWKMVAMAIKENYHELNKNEQ